MNTISNDRSPPFVPPRWLRGGHRQTIAASYFPGAVSRAPLIRHRVTLDDGDQLIMHENRPATADNHFSQTGEPRAALLIPGLSGCHASGYMARTATKLWQHGVHVFRLDMRGAGAGEDLAKSTNHAGRSDDIYASLLEVCRTCPGAQVTLIGFSLGAAMLLRMLGRNASDIPAAVDRALVVSPPIELATCCNHLQRGLGRMYDRTLSRWMYAQVKRRRRSIEAIAKLDVGPAPRSMRDFDASFTAPLGGFASVDEYYDQSSASHVLKDIRLPVQIITSADDPVVPIEMFGRAQLAPQTNLQVTAHGGHLGFLGRNSTDPDRWWLDWRIVDFVCGTRSHTNASL